MLYHIFLKMFFKQFGNSEQLVIMNILWNPQIIHYSGIQLCLIFFQMRQIPLPPTYIFLNYYLSGAYIQIWMCAMVNHSTINKNCGESFSSLFVKNFYVLQFTINVKKKIILLVIQYWDRVFLAHYFQLQFLLLPSQQ